MRFKSIKRIRDFRALQKPGLFLFLVFLFPKLYSQDTQFEIFTGTPEFSILYDKKGSPLDSISASLLAEDIYKVSHKKPLVTTDVNKTKGNTIVIGQLNSDLISKFVGSNDLPRKFKNQNESFLHKVVKDEAKKILVVAGTDPRGTAYGVFELSEKIGVSPWYWWADVPVKKQKEIIIEQEEFYSKEPSVEFRGIFLNDEDWGLQPWAEKTFEPEVGDIGPKTYAKIFELLLRLKANTIWPAMHPSTKAFFHYQGNPEMAEKYQIVIGTSHAEPMLRNNVDEWDKEPMGSFNYLSNKENVYKYWEERVKETKDIDAIYTLGMRGIHDSGMEGVKGIEEAKANLQNVLKDQRKLLKTYSSKEVTGVPQAFTVYKEVLDVYDHGLELPEDVTIVWTDDNYGYIRRLGNEEERARKGGGGVYYHASYWGRPHDYQWLSTTHPALIRNEMMKAYKNNSRKMWILNVGDLKPAEYNMQLFMDMAYDIEKFEEPEYVDKHMQDFYSNAFGKAKGKPIANIKKEYYNLAFERKPEFMGWSQTEPTTKIDTTAYTPFSWGDEINRRIDSYEALEEKTEKIQHQIPEVTRDAYFQLVHYPVKAASFMNKKFLYRDLALKYLKQNRLIVKKYKNLSHTYYDSIASITRRYNEEVSGGKWKGMMDMAPRKLPVFDKPEISFYLDPNYSTAAGISVENASGVEDLQLPAFYENSPQNHFFDIYLKQPKSVKWSVQNVPSWLQLSETKGNLTKDGITEKRITVAVDWQKWRQVNRPKNAELNPRLGKRRHKINMQLRSYKLAETGENIFTEQNGLVVIYAENYSGKTDRDEFKWERIPGLGYSRNLMQSFPLTGKPLDTLQLQEKSPYLEYTLYTESLTKNAELVLHALPTHPLTNEHGMRIGVQWNDGPVEIVDFRTYGRSEEWKQNVLRNLAKVHIPVEIQEAGKQILKIYMVDQGVALDFIYVNLQDQSLPYSLLPETRFN
ncbi:hypothetical protein APR41_05785 [Salegentibacter salinarum]|uniref:Gylcosyl hydrolase 115 C-terminal domain-containing protein n=1 Tax=Salegentibacter salinarum TaxID=447422 RepID=A0A2N0TSL2_9FLAO|nr:glycosyl hydrolase 115 family protein [Salegentibacter salinarum]PKD17715.1 hypothetical protein APR41_05785 [Salegentibacter salinarum]SKB51390.1 Glycosyl hydrolase family 115 [Salegentibacter salinarum]